MRRPVKKELCRKRRLEFDSGKEVGDSPPEDWFLRSGEYSFAVRITNLFNIYLNIRRQQAIYVSPAEEKFTEARPLLIICLR